MINLKVLGISTSLLLAVTVASASAEEGIKYRAALDGTLAPHAMPDLSGGVVGLNVDLVNAIADRLGADIELVAAQFSGLVPALQAGTYDFLAAPTTITEERAENMLSSEGIMVTNYQFAVPVGSAKRTSLEDFKGAVIAVNKGSTYERFLGDMVDEYGWQVTTYGSDTDAFEAVSSGRADAMLTGATSAAWAASQNHRLELSFEYVTGLAWGFNFRKDDTETRNRIESAIECLKIDGTLEALAEKWLGETPEGSTTVLDPIPGYGMPGFDGYEDTPHEFSCDL